MNLESTPSNKNNVVMNDDFGMDDFDFKPLTSGLGFNQNKPTTEVKPAFVERPVVQQIQTSAPISPPRKEQGIYQNDLSIFYNREQTLTPPPLDIPKEEKIYRKASKPQRILAYFLDMSLLLSFLGIILTVMSRTIGMDLLEVWTSYPHEMTPLVTTLFCGFYLMYFSIFEKTDSSTVGKYLLGIKVVDNQNRVPGFSTLMIRSFVSLINFVSLGLFSYFGLQDKTTNSKVIRVD